MTLLKNKTPRFGTEFPAFTSLLGDLLTADFPKFIGNEMTKTIPAVNIKESEKDYKLEIAAPGLEKENFNLSVEDNVLVISSEVKQENEESSEKFTRKEFSFSSFERRFTLPETVNSDDISATYTNGILTLVLPKRVEVLQNTKKQISIA